MENDFTIEDLDKDIFGRNRFEGMTLSQLLNLPAPVVEKAIRDRTLPRSLFEELLRFLQSQLGGTQE